MQRKFIVVAAVVLVALAGAVGAVLTGWGPAGGNNSEDIGDFPTQNETDGGGSDGSDGTDGGSGTDGSDGSDGTDGGGSGTGDGGGGSDGGDGSGGSDGSADPGPPFSFDVKNIEKCGDTCRDVTVTLNNNQDEEASDVTVYTRIFAGNGTAEGDRVWQGKQEVGTMGPESSFTGTKRVQLSYREGYAIQQADGWITIQTTVQTADTTVTFTERRDVL
jgi:hypothetical protein